MSVIYWLKEHPELIGLILSSLLFLLSLCFFIKKLKKHKGDIINGDAVIMFVSLLLSGFFIMFFSEKSIDLQGVSRCAESFYMSLKLFYADGNATFNFDSTKTIAYYKVLYYVLAFYAPVTLIGTVISYFEDFLNTIKIRFLAKYRNVIIFNELNERNLAIAKNFIDLNVEKCEKKESKIANAFFDYKKFCYLENKNKKIFAFCDVYKENKETNCELKDSAIELGCFLFKDDIINLHKKIRKSLKKNNDGKLIRYFLSGVDENENIYHAVELSELEKEAPIKNFAIFTFANGEANGHIIEALNTKEEFFVKRISPAFMMAKNIIANEKNLLITTDNIEKDLKVLILGVGRYGFEIGKFLSWYYQRLKGNITIYFVDKEKGVLSSLSGSYKDFLEYKPNLSSPEQNSCFEIKFSLGIDIFSDDFFEVLKEVYNDSNTGVGLDAVFCALGNDNLNIESALYIRKLLDRINYNKLSQINLENLKQENGEFKNKDFKCEEYTFNEAGKLTDNIKIYSIVHNNQFKKCVSRPGGFIDDCNICFVGEDALVYSCQNIFDAKMEEKAVENDRGVTTVGSKIIRYNSNEYYRNSSLTELLNDEYIEKYLYPKNATKEYAELRCKVGNKRWNAYMLADGYTTFDVNEEFVGPLFKQRTNFLPLRQWQRGKWHSGIAPFDKLSKEEQENNYCEKAK